MCLSATFFFLSSVLLLATVEAITLPSSVPRPGVGVDALPPLGPGANKIVPKAASGLAKATGPIHMDLSQAALEAAARVSLVSASAASLEVESTKEAERKAKLAAILCESTQKAKKQVQKKGKDQPVPDGDDMEDDKDL